jgi:hypothetical protein
MNIFQYQGQEEDHYTNILMNLLSLNNCKLVEPFLKKLLENHIIGLSFKGTSIYLRKKNCPQLEKPIEILLGVAPFMNALDERNTLEDNLNSIPDAWICGENFNILLEFKIRGNLDEGQLAAHRKLLGNNATIVRLKWEDVVNSLRNCKDVNDDPIYDFLIDQFLEVSQGFKRKRKSSGMPVQVISNINNESKLYFIITGSKKTGVYTIDKVYNQKTERLNDNINGIIPARKWIAKYVMDNFRELPLEFHGDQTIISDYCVVPGRPEKKNQWNQWRLGTLSH